MKFLIAAMFGVAALAASAAAADDGSQAKPELAAFPFDGKVILSGVGQKDVQIVWDALPSPKLIARFVPFQSGSFGVVGIGCKGISSDGRLVGCTAYSDSSVDGGYKMPAEALAKHLTVTKQLAESVKSRVHVVMFKIALVNSDQPVVGSHCWPDRCPPNIVAPAR